MKSTALQKIDEAINIVKQDSCYLTQDDQLMLESKLQSIRDVITETYEFRMTSLQQEN